MSDDALKDYYRASHRLREALENDLYMDAVDRMTLENFIALMQMTYKNYKRRNPDNWAPSSDDRGFHQDRFSSLTE